MTVRQRGFHGLLDDQYAVLVNRAAREFVPHHLVTHSRRLLYQFRTHFHPYAERLVAELMQKDVQGLENLDTREPPLQEDFFEALYKPALANPPESATEIEKEPAAAVLGDRLPLKNLDFDYAEGAYSVHNWEVFFHLPFVVGLQLSKAQRFAEAQRWFHCIFDPTDATNGPAPQRFWKFQPFRAAAPDDVEKALLNLSTGDDEALRERTRDAIGQWRDNPLRPHLIARTRPTAYMYATVTAYLDNLIAWGDSLFRQDTRESAVEAMQYYVLASNILGPKPQVVPKKGSLKKQTYADLRSDLDEFGNAVRELEAEIPFDLLGVGRPVDSVPAAAPLESLGRSLYFCIPRNDKLLGYWDTVGDRLFKLRNSLSLDGVFRQLPLFAPPIDPALLARAVAAGVDVASIVAGTATPLAPVRFQVLLQKALEVCQEVKALGGQILAALEKRDNEALSLLRAQNESRLLILAESVRYAQWQEAIKNREGVQQNILNVSERYRYYQQLLGKSSSDLQFPVLEPLDEAAVLSGKISEPAGVARELIADGTKVSSGEREELDKLSLAQGLQDGAAALEGIGTLLNIIPTFTAEGEPIGLGLGTSIGGTNLSALLSGLANVARGFASHVTYEASQAGKLAGYARREQEWSFQSNAAAGELIQLYKQFRAAEIREYIARRERENQQQQSAQAKDVEDFLTNEKRKTTTEGFYLWLKREAQGLHARSFQFAYDIAKKAERAFQHEIGDPSATFVSASYLSGREGLFAGEKLYFDLKRMDLAYAELNTREFELVKHIGLRDWFPLQLLQLRQDGTCDINVAEALFDLDCPGHSFRRIKSVAVTIPCVTGPYASVNCGLRLLSSRVRTQAIALDGSWYPKSEQASDLRFASHPVAADAIVTSSAQSDFGVFDPNLADGRYLPFEGAGVISTWTLELLGTPSPFDRDTIADVILTFRYTARPGAPEGAVSVAARQWLAENSAQLFSLRHDFPSQWAAFARAERAPDGTATLSFKLGDEHFPYRLQAEFPHARRLHLRARTKVEVVTASLFRVSMGQLEPTMLLTGNLTKGDGVLMPPAAGTPGFDPRGNLELRLDTNELEELYAIVDWHGSDEPETT